MSQQAQAVVQKQPGHPQGVPLHGSILQHAAVIPAITPVHSGILQRCSNGVECEECRQKRLGMLQRAAVNAAPVNESGVPPIVHEVLNSPGQALDAGTRAFMEPRFGYDFSQVRVHTDARAAESAQAVNALAYTVGRDVVFGEGRYEPGTSEGRRLLAHELTHVVQQRGVSTFSLSKGERSNSGDPSEHEAEGVASAIAYGREIPTIVSAGRGLQKAECTKPPLKSRRDQGFRYGIILAEAANTVTLHNDLPVPDDWEFIPDYRRPFINKDNYRQWRVVPAPVDISNPEEIACFVEGVNTGLDRFAESERFWGRVAEALQLLSVALSTRSAMRIGAPEVAAPRPRLRYIRGGGGAPSEPGAAPSIPSPSVRVPIGGGPRGATAAAPVPVTETPPAPAPAPRPRPQLVHSQPEPAPKAQTQPFPFFPPLPSPVLGQRGERKADCRHAHPEVDECWLLELEHNYEYADRDLKSARETAFESLQRSNRSVQLEAFNIDRKSTAGPCPDQGTHTNVRDLNRPRGDNYFGSIVCCPCCLDEPTGPELEARCGFVPTSSI